MLNSEIDDLIKKMNGNFSIYVKDLTNDKVLYEKDLDRVLPTASTIKTLILVNAFEQIEEGKIFLDSMIPINMVENVPYGMLTHMKTKELPLYDIMLMMMSISDNLATNIMIEILGMDNINRTAEKLGLKDLRLRRKMMDFEAAKKGLQNVGTPRELCRLSEIIYKRQTLTEGSCQTIEKLMSIDISSDYMKRYIPEKVKVVHKTGGLDNLNHDVGIIYLKNIDYALGIFLTEVSDNIIGAEQIARLSEIFYKYILNEYRGDF